MPTSSELELSNAVKAALRDIDLDAIGSDFDAANQGHDDCFDFVRRLAKFLRDLAPALDQLPLSAACRGFRCRWQSRSSPRLDKNLRSLLITTPSKLPAGIRRRVERVLPSPFTRDVDT